MLGQKESVEITKFSKQVFAEAIIELLLNNGLNKGDGTFCVVTDLQHNEDQSIIKVEMSDESVFSIKIT